MERGHRGGRGMGVRHTTLPSVEPNRDKCTKGKARGVMRKFTENIKALTSLRPQVHVRRWEPCGHSSPGEYPTALSLILS